MKRTDRTWEGVQKFFNTKIKELKTMASAADVTTNKEKLLKACASKVAENIERQLSQIAFFNQDHKGQLSDTTLEKMKYTPLSNSGCESRMAQLDVKVKFSGGAAPLKTLSNKQVVSVNKYLMTEDFNDDQDTLAVFRWARNSTEAK